MTRPTVSVVLPCYNAAATLAEAVESICAQTFEDWELILFDDGSTDGSINVGQDLAGKDRRIRHVLSDHVGIVVALQRGCAEANGYFLARMDADDVLPTRIVWRDKPLS